MKSKNMQEIYRIDRQKSQNHNSWRDKCRDGIHAVRDSR